LPRDISKKRELFHDLLYRKPLPSGIGLFEPGNPDDATDPPGFVMRVNRQIFVRAIRPNSRSRFGLATTISAKGQLGLHAELIVFGTWMVCNSMPCSKRRRVKALDLRRLFKALAVAFAALNAKTPTTTTDGTGVKTRQIKSKDIVKFLKIFFYVTTITPDHSAPLRSLRIILPEYLALLAAGHLEFNGLKVTRSPQMSKLAEALKKPGSTSTARATCIGSTLRARFKTS